MSRDSRKHARRRRLKFERLSDRICLAVGADLDNGVLTVLGTSDDDSLSISDDGQGIVSVRDLGTGQAREFGGVREIVVATDDGKDTVTYRRKIGTAPLPALTVETGPGSDSLDIEINFSKEDIGLQKLELDIRTDAGDDEVSIGLLLPAVQKVREAAASITADLGHGENRFELQSKGVGQVELDLTTGDDDDEVLIGLLLPAVQKVREAADRDLPNVDLDLKTNGGDDDVSVALLLPAVQKVREAAARTTADLGHGENRFELQSKGVGRVELDLTTGDNNDEVLIGLLLPAVQKVREAAAADLPDVDLDLKTNGGDDDVSVALLLPAVQKVREAAARTTADLGHGENRFELQSKGVGQVELDLTTGDDNDEVLIGLLLPAVQKVREAADRDLPDVDLDLKTNGGDDEVSVALLLPAVQKVREAAARTTADLGHGENRFELQSKGVGQVELDLTTGDDNDEVLIGLLLPAVQKVREAAADLPDVDLDLKTNGGDDEVVIGLLLPAVQKVREAAARITADLGDGHDRFNLGSFGVPNVETALSLGSGDDEASISLLLPALQKVRESTALTTVDSGPGADNVRLRIRGYETVDTTILSDPDEDSIDDGSAHGLDRLRR